MKINVLCQGVNSGYGQVAEGLRQGLRAHGVQVVEEPAGLAVVVNPSFAMRGFWKGQETWLLSMWESTRVPEVVVENLHNFAGVVVPNALNVEQFGEHHPNVHLVRLGLDPDVWVRQKRELAPEFRVLVVSPKPGGNDIRKGTAEAEEAFRKAFPDVDRLTPRPVLNIVHTRGQLSQAEMVKLFHDHHCYLALAKGEGWHMLPFQMLATGGPVVVSDNPGHMEWAAWLPGTHIVPTTLGPCPIGGVGTTWSGEWWEPNVEVAAEKLRHVYDNYRTEREISFEAAQVIHNRLSWEDTAEAFLDVVGRHERPDPERVWVECDRRLFPATALVTDTFDIGEDKWSLRRGHTVELSADALRVLIGSGAVAA